MVRLPRLLLCCASLHAAESLVLARGPAARTSCAARRRAVQPRASAVDGAVNELETRLRRQLTPAEVNLAHQAVDSAIRELEARFSKPDAREAVREDELKKQREPAGGAALAAASWGSWRNKARTDATARVRHVLLDSEDKALSLLKELTFGADIGQLAAEHSLCPSKDKGGDLGVFVPGDMVAEFETFVFDESAPIGVPLGPVRTPFGYHLIIIDERTL